MGLLTTWIQHTIEASHWPLVSLGRFVASASDIRRAESWKTKGLPQTLIEGESLYEEVAKFMALRCVLAWQRASDRALPETFDGTAASSDAHAH